MLSEKLFSKIKKYINDNYIEENDFVVEIIEKYEIQSDSCHDILEKSITEAPYTKKSRSLEDLIGQIYN